MRLPLVLMLPLLVLGILTDWYIYRAVRVRVAASWLRKLQLVSALFFNAFLVALTFWPKKTVGDESLIFIMWGLFGYFSIYFPKYVFVLIDLLASIPCLFKHKRWRWLSFTGAGAAVVIFVLMWWGAWNASHNIEVKTVYISNSELPQSFNGLRAVQISDLHVGTYGTDTAFVSKLVDKVNSLQPDVIFFTGDIVNRRTEEILPFVNVLSQLKAPLGVFSVLGNHDYGDYFNWPDSLSKRENLQQLIDIQELMGWNLLNNRTEFLRTGCDSVAVVGVENIGDPPFHVYGNLEEAYPGQLDDGAFKVLLSHNPAHWQNDIMGHADKNIALTLSGHTHAMQMELFGKSPAALRYPFWGGRYDDEENSDKELYVNIGTGEVGIPARIGATPEITLLIFNSDI